MRQIYATDVAEPLRVSNQGGQAGMQAGAHARHKRETTGDRSARPIRACRLCFLAHILIEARLHFRC